MLYNGSLVGPTLLINPGDRVELSLVNSLDEPTNLHFHGLHVSPSGDSDNVFRQVNPGETAKYTIEISVNHPPGTFWYHSHQHGLAYKQVSQGLSGLIVVDGLTDLLPKSLQESKQRTFAIKDFQVENGSDTTSIRTVNGKINPELSIDRGETQLWRLSNIGSETFYNIVLPDHIFYVIAEDGMPVWRVWNGEQLLLPSGKRYDVLVTGNGTSANSIDTEIGKYPLTALSYHQGCVICPEVTLATLNVSGTNITTKEMPSSLIPPYDLNDLPVDRNRTLIFTSVVEENRYMINGNVFDPMRIDQLVQLGDIEEWTLMSMDDDEHPFHIHVNDFQVMSVNGQPYDAHGLQDTVMIPPHGEVVIRIPFKDFEGKFVYHCHILFHEDGGMMGVVKVV
jgi:FtsP/CotA-like multicopper oxidase with cupredoxin domain